MSTAVDGLPVRAVVSLGTNSTRFLLVRQQFDGHFEELAAGSVGTRLGEGLGAAGELVAAAVDRNLAAIESFLPLIRPYKVSMACIATSALRRASNAQPFIAEVERRTGARLDILDGSREAEYSYIGATYGEPLREHLIAVLDVGGGSTECALGRNGTLEDSVSCEIGAVRLAERFPELLGAAPGEPAKAAAKAARRDARSVLAPLANMRRSAHAIAVAGTPLTVGAIAYRCDLELVSGRTLSVAQIDGAVGALLELDLAARKAMPGMVAQRADILPAGAIVVAEALRLLGADRAKLERNDLLLGYLICASGWSS